MDYEGVMSPTSLIRQGVVRDVLYRALSRQGASYLSRAGRQRVVLTSVGGAVRLKQYIIALCVLLPPTHPMGVFTKTRSAYAHGNSVAQNSY